jgi:hypothetical protein
MLKAQYKHLRGYLDDVQSGAETRGTAGQRAKNFLGSARQGFSRGRGRAYGLDLPVHPGDGGTPCVPGETDVFAPDIEVAFERFYEGAIIELDLSNGNHLTITPNHPVLTNKGWVKAGLLYEGDYVVSHIGFDAHSRQEHDPKCSPSAIGQIFRSLPPHLRVRAKGSGMDFHGDGKEGNIDIVFANGFLWNRLQPPLPVSVPVRSLPRALRCNSSAVVPLILRAALALAERTRRSSKVMRDIRKRLASLLPLVVMPALNKRLMMTPLAQLRVWEISSTLPPSWNRETTDSTVISGRLG